MARTRTVGWAVLILLAVAGVLIYILSDMVFSVGEVNTTQPQRQMNEQQARIVGAEDAAIPLAQVMRPSEGTDRPDLLGNPVMSSDGVRLGTLFDLFIDPYMGDAQWMAVDVSEEGTEEPTLVYIPLQRVRELRDGEGVFMNVAESIFQEGSLNNDNADKVRELVSLRMLPGAPVMVPDGSIVGEVVYAGYNEDTVSTIVFRASESNDVETEAGLFAIAFDAINIQRARESDPILSQIVSIHLNERQAGALDAYLLEQDASEGLSELQDVE